MPLGLFGVSGVLGSPSGGSKGLVSLGLGVGFGLVPPFTLTESLHPDSISYFARVTAAGGTQSTAQRASIDAQIKLMNARGLRSKCKRWNPMMGTNSAAMLIPIYNDWGTAADLLVGAPAMSTRGMVVTTSGQYLRTGVQPSTQSGWDSRDSSLGVFLTEGNTTGANTCIIGAYSNSGTLRYGLQWNTTSIIFAYGGTTAENVNRNSRTTGMNSGLRMISCTSGAINYYEDGISVIAAGSNPTNGKPASEIYVGNISNGGTVGSGVFSGYFIGTGYTAAECMSWSEVTNMGAQTAGTQESWVVAGDSLTSSSTWAATVTTNSLPRRSRATIAIGGISSLTLYNQVVAAFATNPSLKYLNVHVWIGQNDSSVGGWDGNNTIANIAAILGLFPHKSYKVVKMVYGNRPDEYIGQTKRITKDYVSTQLGLIYGAKAIDFRAALNATSSGAGQDLVDTTNGIHPSICRKRLASLTITGITKASAAVVTFSAAHGLVTGDCGDISGIVGMVELNGQTVQATVINTTQISINRDSTAYATYGSSGSFAIVDFIHINGTVGDTATAGVTSASLPF